MQDAQNSSWHTFSAIKTVSTSTGSRIGFRIFWIQRILVHKRVIEFKKGRTPMNTGTLYGGSVINNRRVLTEKPRSQNHGMLTQ